MQVIKHKCGTKHRTVNAAARCQWPRAVTVLGEGRYATLSDCPHGPHAKTALVIHLHEGPDAAQNAINFINRLGCGGRCEKRHWIVFLA